MYIRLALRNFKRQMGSYAVYFVTVLTTIALLFSVNNIVYSSDILKTVSESDLGDDMKKTAVIEGMTLFSGIIALINSRAQIYILGLRKRELGTYLLLGMKRKDITKLFILEITILFSITIAAGLLLGVIMYQGVMSVLYSFMDMQFKLTGYSVNSFLVTICQGLIIFVVSALSTAEVLRKSNIMNLIEDRKKKVSKISKTPLMRSVVLIIICIAFWYAVVMAQSGSITLLTDESSGTVLAYIIVGIIMIFLPVSILIFNMAYPRCLTELMLRTKRFSGKGTNKFVLRQLSDKTYYNSSTFAAIAMIVTVVTLFINVIGMSYCITDQVVRRYPCNMITSQSDSQSIENILDKYTVISNKVNYNSIVAPEINSLKMVTLISETTCNQCMKMNGESSVKLNGTYKIAVKSESEKDNKDNLISKQHRINYNKMDPFQIGENSAEYSGLLVTRSIQQFTIVVPDRFFEIIKLSDLKYNTDDTTMYKYKVRRSTDIEEWEKEMNQSQIVYWAEEEKNSLIRENAPMVLALIFVNIMLLILSMSIIALKITSEIPDDRVKYQKLYEIGVNKKTLKKTLFKQNSAFFLFPLVQPLIFAFFISKFNNELLIQTEYSEVNQSYSVAITYMIIGIIFALYLTITYLFMKKKIIAENEQRKL